MVEKQGQKIRAGVSPPPFRAMPKRKHFFFVRASLTDLVNTWVVELSAALTDIASCQFENCNICRITPCLLEGSTVRHSSNTNTGKKKENQGTHLLNLPLLVSPPLLNRSQETDFQSICVFEPSSSVSL